MIEDTLAYFVARVWSLCEITEQKLRQSGLGLFSQKYIILNFSLVYTH